MRTKKKLNDKLVIVLTAILTISLAFNLILAVSKSGKGVLINENTKLNQQIAQYKDELNKYQGISQSIDQAIKDAKLSIEAKEKQIASLIQGKRRSEKENKVLIQQVDSIKEQYLVVIDSLLVEREKNKVINNRIASLEEIVNDLNTRIGVAGWLIADNFRVTPVKKAANNKKNPTALVKKVNEFEICFDILENKTSKPGSRNIYIVITSPDARVIYDSHAETKTFHHPEYDKLAECSLTEVIEYKNQKLSHCISLIPGSTLSTGLYVAELFTEENKLGMTTFSLK